MSETIENTSEIKEAQNKSRMTGEEVESAIIKSGINKSFETGVAAYLVA